MTQTFTNYEHAQSIFDHGDPLARAIAAFVHRWMISEHGGLNATIRPSASFDVVYFYDALARTFAALLKQSIDTGLTVDRGIRPLNVPDFREEAWRRYPFVEKGIASQFVECVCADAVDDGRDFDVTFACKVACEAMDEAAIDTILNGQVFRRDADDFDSWLACFSTSADESDSDNLSADNAKVREAHTLASRYATGGATE